MRGLWLCLEGVGKRFVVVVVVVVVSDRTIWNVQAVVAVVAVAAAAVLNVRCKDASPLFAVSALVVGEVASAKVLRASASCCLLGVGSLVSF